MRVVLDTSTLVSGIAWEGEPARILNALLEGQHALVTSAALLAEFTRVLQYHKLRKVRTHPLLPAVLEWLFRPEHLVVPSERVDTIKADPADNLVLEAALAGRAEVVVTGDHDLLQLKEFRGVRIVSPRVFTARYL